MKWVQLDNNEFVVMRFDKVVAMTYDGENATFYLDTHSGKELTIEVTMDIDDFRFLERLLMPEGFMIISDVEESEEE